MFTSIPGLDFHHGNGGNLNAGTDGGLWWAGSEIDVDVDGDPRPLGAWDIGIDED